MLSRAHIPIVFCGTVLGSLPALACGNSMDAGISLPIGVDLVSWTVGAVFLNRVVLKNVIGPFDEEEEPSQFRRSFFLLVGVALILLLVTITAGVPILSLSGDAVARCSMSTLLLLALVASPLVLFLLQAELFQRLNTRGFSSKSSLTLIALVITSLFLAGVVGKTRDGLILPNLCSQESGITFMGVDEYNEQNQY
ncbi:hypothetical protein [Hyalangium versicolor]|uniref:hypothetical protein n=1 Tax=Hyalangium versicolor TaxID=2861190 RepID=UPI001CCD1926|nr:hypothetical protein [Hyalangium versicolor]